MLLTENAEVKLGEEAAAFILSFILIMVTCVIVKRLLRGRSGCVLSKTSNVQLSTAPQRYKQCFVCSGFWCECSAGPYGGTEEHVYWDPVLDGPGGHRL